MTQRTQAAAEGAPGIGDAIGHYRLVGLIGDGSLGRLYIAEQRKIRDVSHTVALQCIRAELARNAHFRALFLDAASLAPRFEHHNLVSIYEMNEIDGSCFFSREYVPGENVAAILTKCNTGAQVPVDIAASIVKHTANAVQYLHDRRVAAGKQAGLGPGELDPSSVFVTFHGTVKWLASGLRPLYGAKGSVSGAHEVDAWSRAATYGALEHFEGLAEPRADVFSLGALLWTCLNGQKLRLALGDGQGDVADGSDEATPPLGRGVDASCLRADVPEALQAIVTRALAADPEQRFQSAREMSEALDRYLLRRASRPTHKHIRRWLENLFGADRASRQLEVAQGRGAPASLASPIASQPAGGAESVLPSRTSQRARELWSTRHSVFSELARGSLVPPRSSEAAPSSLSQDRLPTSAIVVRDAPQTLRAAPPGPASAPPKAAPSRAPEPRTWMAAAMIAVCALIALGAAAILRSPGESSPLGQAPQGSQLAELRGQLQVHSTPEGAAVFVDGEPTGLYTPAALKGLTAGRSLRLRVEKAGFASQQREVTIVAGAVETQSFELLASDGLVRFAGVPANARIFVDEELVASGDGNPLSLAVGRHAVRVETQSALVFSGTVVVVAGEQTIRVDGAAATQ